MSSTPITKVLARFDEAVGAEGRGSFRPSATSAKIEAAEATLDVSLPPSLRALYAWRDGETPASTLFHDALHARFETLWGTYSKEPFEIGFMSLAEVASAGPTDLWIHSEGEVTRTEPEGDDAEPTVCVPFLWIRAENADEPADREIGDADWLLAVDSTREAVWLFEVGEEGLEGVIEQAPNLSAWLESVAKTIAARREPKKEAVPAAPLQAPAVLCLRFMLDRKLIELEEGADVATVAAGIKPLLALKPPKRAVRAVLDHLSEDDAIAEVFAEDDLLAKIIVEFVD